MVLSAERRAGMRNLVMLLGVALVGLPLGVMLNTSFGGRGRFQTASVMLLYGVLTARAMAKWDARSPIVTCEHHTNLVVQTGSGLDDRVRVKLLAEALAHPDGGGQHLTNDAFAGTRGFVLKFNEQGSAQLRDHASPWHFLLPFFDVARDPSSNAFVLNLLVVEALENDGGGADEESGQHGREPVTVHIDNTVGIDSDYLFVAHSVSVLYLAVPEAQSGGVLQLFAPSPVWLHFNPRRDAQPSMQIVPSTEEGREFVVFRGDAPHRVSAIRLANKRPRRSAVHANGASDGALSSPPRGAASQEQLRVSLVLEQYRVGAAHYGQTTYFAVNRDSASLISWWRRIGF